MARETLYAAQFTFFFHEPKEIRLVGTTEEVNSISIFFCIFRYSFQLVNFLKHFCLCRVSVGWTDYRRGSPPSLHSHPSCLSEERSSKLKEYCTWLESWAHARDILKTGWCQRWFWYATDVGRLFTVQWGYIAGRRGDYMILTWRCWFCDFKQHSAAV